MEVMIFGIGGGFYFRPPNGPEIVPVLDRFFTTMSPFLPKW